ncbi:MAG: hypothetical protein AAF456_06340 [Planctomycetota bacterium]
MIKPFTPEISSIPRALMAAIIAGCAFVVACASSQCEAQALFRDPLAQEPATVESIPSLGSANQDVFVTEPGAFFPQTNGALNPLPAQRNSFVPGGTPSTNLTAPAGVQSPAVENIEPGRLIRREREEEPLTPTREGNELVTQNYPDGKKLLEKEVRQDEDGNYVNHGLWRVYTRDGRVQATGQFDMGKMVGVWKRIHDVSDGGIFSERPFNMYTGPFLSVASFSDDQLNGSWIISDRNQQKVFEIQYKEGVRHGTAVWLYPTSARMRVATFKDGVLDGGLYEWNEEDKLTREEEYREGRRVVRQTTAYRPGVLSSESYYLDGRLELDGSDDWWEATPAPMRQTDAAYQNGPVNVWYSNGQPEMRGRYVEGKRTGKFTWWHENGSKKGEGWFEEGRKTGLWIWWHDNGMKSIEGSYEDDRMAGEWTWWHDDGRVRATEDKDADPTGGSYDDIFSIIDEDDEQDSEDDQPSILSRDDQDGDAADSEEGAEDSSDESDTTQQEGPAEIGNTRVDPLEPPAAPGTESEGAPTDSDTPPESPLVEPEPGENEAGIDLGIEQAEDANGSSEAEEIPPGTIVPDGNG